MTPTLQDLIQDVKNHPDFAKAGMILCHNGVVRESSRDGKRVKGLRVLVDHERLAQILERAKTMPGIVDVRVWIQEEKDLQVGDDVMFIVVAGDIREHVVSTLTSTLEAIKKEATRKTEYPF
ncbi:molybdenum cofactor biosynthesis protein MoaE [Desulfobotulus sp.]|jgi:molybdopterin synthase catalytic subunit|uniref:molybdenum cofactor biosynthesis protein MoaE n=1 Tax=Desulfobotulus sp. TaxID=1940337 RepID=UPI002A36756D|nr:molybdenum cofactor biosynthesis protein MoaE [Desulfobotulus sp.]MDY0162414.1 molybdenum cofactor biosynthesis protein MoaE [Desulfobotulus sp.]